MKIQDLIPVIEYTTKLAICTGHNMLFFGTKEELLSETQSNVYLIVCTMDIENICIEQNAMRIQI